MPTARPIIEMMFVTNRLNSTICPTSAVMPRAIPMATIAIPIGTSAATMAPKTTTSTMQRHHDADRLALLGVLLGDRGEVGVQRGLAGAAAWKPGRCVLDAAVLSASTVERPSLSM